MKKNIRIDNLNKYLQSLAHGVQEYVINGVRYTVESRYDPKFEHATIGDRLKKSISSDYIRLPVDANDGIITAEYVCSDCDVSIDTRKENLVNAAE